MEYNQEDYPQNLSKLQDYIKKEYKDRLKQENDFNLKEIEYTSRIAELENQLKAQQQLNTQLNEVIEKQKNSKIIQSLRNSQVEMKSLMQALKQQSLNKIGSQVEDEIQKLEEEKQSLKEINEQLINELSNLEQQIEEIKALAIEAMEEKVQENTLLQQQIQELQAKFSEQVTDQTSLMQELFNSIQNKQNQQKEKWQSQNCQLIEKFAKEYQEKVQEIQCQLEERFNKQNKDLKDKFLGEIKFLEQKVSELENQKILMHQEFIQKSDVYKQKADQAIEKTEEKFVQDLNEVQQSLNLTLRENQSLMQKLKELEDYNKQLKEEIMNESQKYEQRIYSQQQNIDALNIELKKSKHLFQIQN